MRKRLFILALELLAISVPLTWLWIEWGRSAYPKLFIEIGTPILVWFGLPGVQPDVLPDRFISYVPFLVLMVITPRIGVARRVLGTVLGFALIFLSHVAFTSYVMAFEYSERLSARPFVNIFPALLLLDSFPIVVWAIIAKDFVGEVAARALPQLFPRR